jgi:hypothetical protein
VPRAMSSDVGMGSAVGGEPRRGSSGSSKASSKKGKERMVPTAENYAGPSLSRRGSEKPEDLTRQDYVNMLGDDVFKAFVRRREAALRAAAEIQKMKMMSRHSARYIDSHEQSLTNEFGKFLEYADLQRQREARRAKLLGLPPRTAPANVFAVRPAGSFGLRTPETLTREDWNDRRASAKRYLKIQMERIQNLRVARTRSTRSLKGTTPPLQAIDLSDAIRRKTWTPRRPTTQFSAAFLHGEPPHYAVFPTRPATVPAEPQADIYRWMEDFFREHVPVEEGESLSSRSGKRSTLKDSQLRDEQM